MSEEILKVVEKFIDNMNKSSKNVTDSVTNNMHRIEDSVSSINEKMNTPPRHEELNDKLRSIESKMDIISKTIDGTMRTIRVVASVITLAILIATIVMYFGTRGISVEDLKSLEDKIECMEEKVQKYHNVEGS